MVDKEQIAYVNGPKVQLRRATPGDAEACGHIFHEAFSGINHQHRFPPEVPTAEAAIGILTKERGLSGTRLLSGFGYFGHAVGGSNMDLQALLWAAEVIEGPGVIVPTRNAELFRWCLESGMQIVQPMTLLSIGLYNEPAGAYLTSISY